MSYPPAGYPPGGNWYPGWHPDPFQGDPAGPADPFPGGQWPSPGPPPRRRKTTWVVVLTVAVVVIVTLGAGAVLWGLNARSAAGGGTAATTVAGTPGAPPPKPPDTGPRPSTDDLVGSLERAPAGPRWTYTADGEFPDVIGGNAAIVIVATKQRGIIAVDAQTGAPLWPAPVMPAGADPALFYANHCVLDRAGATVGCGFVLENGKRWAVVFFDAKTGVETRRSETVGEDLFGAGDGFVQASLSSASGYRADGTQTWRLDVDVSRYVYGDQQIGVVQSGAGDIKGGDVIDTRTGHVIAHAGRTRGAVYDTGFAFSTEQTIDFYDFAGAKTASIPSQGFRLMTTDDWPGPSRTRPGTTNPLAYNPASGEIRALDGASGRVLWSHQEHEDFGRDSGDRVHATRVGGACFITVFHSDGKSRVKLQDCAAASDNPFTDIPVGLEHYLVGSDGQRMLLKFDTDDTRCVDGVTGQELWRTSEMIGPAWVGSAVYSERKHEIVRWF